VAYNSLLVRSRKEIHQKVGRAMETLYPERQEEFCETLAHHYSKAEDMEKAYEYLRISGDKAYRNYSTSESFRYYREAISVLGRLPDTKQNKWRIVETTLSAWGPMLALGFPEGCLELLKEGERLAEELSDGGRLAKFYAFIAHCLSFRGDSAHGSQYATKALAEAERIGDVDSAVGAATNVIGPLCYRGDFREAANVSARAIDLIERTGKTTERFGSSFPLYPTLKAANGYARGMLGEFDKGESRCEEIVRLAFESNETRTLAVAEVICGFVSVVRAKDLDACLEHLQSGIRHSEESGFRPYLSLAWTCVGWANWLQGNLEAARDCGQKAARIQAEGKVSVMLSLAHLLCGAVSLDCGDLAGALDSIEQALRLSQSSGERDIEGRALAWQGRVLGKADVSQVAAAEERIQQGIRLLEEMKIRPWQAEGHLLAGELYSDTGERQKALTSLGRAQDMFQQMDMTHWLSRTQRTLDKLKT
jgi:tetratricopeptide (TPR) repeat protein